MGNDRSQEPASWPLDDGYENERPAPQAELRLRPVLQRCARGVGPNAPGHTFRVIGNLRRNPALNPSRSSLPRPTAATRQTQRPAARRVRASYADDYADDEYDDEAEPPRRGGTVVIAALLGLAVLGTAGALGYRAISGGSVIPSFPPIIKPADGPIRVKPDQQAQAPNSGQADPANGTGERVVTNQEQPVDVQSGNPIPRMIKTIPVVPNGSPDPAAASGQPPGPLLRCLSRRQAMLSRAPHAAFRSRPCTGRSCSQAGTARFSRLAPVPRRRHPLRGQSRPKPTAAPESPSSGGPLSARAAAGRRASAGTARAVHTATNKRQQRP